MIALLVILGLVIFITWIWLVVVAFQESVGWGLIVLILSFFFSPIPVIIFAAMNWQVAKKPFLIHIIATVLLIVFGFSFIWGLVQETMEMEQQQQQGELSEEEAQRRMFEMLGMEIPPELQRQETEPQTTQDEIAKLTEQLEKNNKPKVAPEPEVQRIEVFKPIKLSRANKHVGKVVQITTINGVVKQGKLTEVRYDRIVMDRTYRGGNFTFEVRNRTIESIAVQEFEEY